MRCPAPWAAPALTSRWGPTIEAYFPFLQPRHPLCRLDTRLLGSTLFFIGEKKAAAAELDMDCGLYFP